MSLWKVLLKAAILLFSSDSACRMRYIFFVAPLETTLGEETEVDASALSPCEDIINGSRRKDRNADSMEGNIVILLYDEEGSSFVIVKSNL